MSLSGILSPLGYGPVSRTAVTFRPVLVVTALIVSMMTS